MAKTHSKPKLTILTLFLILFPFDLLHVESHKFSRNLSTRSLSFKKQKLTHLRFYLHDIVTGDHPTAMEVAQAAVTNTSPTQFGFTVIFDDPLTVGPEQTSKIVGRAQGIYAAADFSRLALMMVENYVFEEGKYNGSTLSIFGRNSVMSPVRELSVVGGSGLFRFARGYALARTYFINTTTRNAVVEYNVYVQHY